MIKQSYQGYYQIIWEPIWKIFNIKTNINDTNETLITSFNLLSKINRNAKLSAIQHC